MPRQWRRVTKSENAAAWKAKRYTQAAPGKFRKTSKTISRRDYQEDVLNAGEKIEQHRARIVRERISRGEAAPEREIKSQRTRQRSREIKEVAARYDIFDSDEDRALINKYIQKRAKLDRGSYSKYPRAARGRQSKFEKAFTPDERQRFRDLFQQYPTDLVRRWLGSDEQSIRARARQEGRNAA